MSVHFPPTCPVPTTRAFPRQPCSWTRSLLFAAKKIRSLVSEMDFLRWGISHTVMIDPPIREHEETLDNPFRASWTACFADKMEPAMVYQLDAFGGVIQAPNPDAAPLALQDRWQYFTILSSSQVAFLRGGILGGWIGVALSEPVRPSFSRLFFLLRKVSVISMAVLYLFELAKVMTVHGVHKKNKIRLLCSHPAIRAPYLRVYRYLYVFPRITKGAFPPVLSSSQHLLPSAVVLTQILPALTPKERARLQQVSKSFLKIFLTRSPL